MRLRRPILAAARASELTAPAVFAGYEVDALFTADKVIVELDSWEFYKHRQSFESARDRDATTLAAAGHVAVRIMWERIECQPGREAERLHRILAVRGFSGRARR